MITKEIDLDRIRMFLNLYHVPISELARQMRFDKAYVSKFLRGKIKPSQTFMVKLSESFEAIAHEKRLDTSYFFKE